MSAAQTSPGFSSPRTSASEALLSPAEGSMPKPPAIPSRLLDRLRGDPDRTEAARAKTAREPSLEQKLLQRLSFGWNLGEQARIDEIGYDAYLEEQLAFNSLDDSDLESALAGAFPALAISAQEIINRYGRNPESAVLQLVQAAVLRAVYSPRQLYERMVTFWSDHFSIDVFAGQGYSLKLVDDREVIRAHAMGRFPELLQASSHSPAMLEYLTNDNNVKDHPNENYGRELMELHTLGADNGYDQFDVREVSRSFTGWSLWNFNLRGIDRGTFRFVSHQHDTGDKTVLGRRIPGSEDLADGEAVIDLLGHHENTARFISYKLLRYFWGYEPPRNLVERVAAKYLETGGNIRSMLRVILKKAWMATSTPKLKRPFHLLVSAARAMGAELTSTAPLLRALDRSGHLPFTWHPPNGFPDHEGYWSGYLMPRWEYALKIAVPGSGLELDLPALDPASNPTLTRDQVRARLDRQFLNRTMSGSTKTVLRDFLADGELADERVRAAIGLVVSSPEFQYY